MKATHSVEWRKQVEPYRLPAKGTKYETVAGDNFGAFQFPNGLRVILSAEMGWDHVSVSRDDRCPTWDEMCWIKDTFFKDAEVVMQLHPAKEHYVNYHPFCLHLWRPHDQPIPTPPIIFV